ncbi:MAG: hypothetical protein LBU32_29360 [Clostridiales bacterium]|nr:hypothetical protein [Clostridiales bacterium]
MIALAATGSFIILIFIGNCLFWSLIIQRVLNAHIGISRHSMDNQAVNIVRSQLDQPERESEMLAQMAASLD